MKRALVLLLFTLASVVVSRAEDLYNNLTSPTSGVVYFYVPGEDTFYGHGNSFSTGSSEFSFSYLGLSVYNNGSATGTLAVGLAIDQGSGTYPQLIAWLGTINEKSFSGYSVQSFIFPTPYSLAPNTRYWIQLHESFPHNTDGLIGWTTSLTPGVGVAGEYTLSDEFGVFPTSTYPGAFQMDVSDTVPAGIPEPGSLALLAAGIGFVLFVGKTRAVLL
ncbi:MAG: PEP-CTERM sorting domain-containing protein [Terriglobales bacterium]